MTSAADLIAELHCHCQQGLLKSRVGVVPIQLNANSELGYGFGRKTEWNRRRRCQLGQLPVKFNLGRAKSTELGDPGDRGSVNTSSQYIIERVWLGADVTSEVNYGRRSSNSPLFGSQ